MHLAYVFDLQTFTKHAFVSVEPDLTLNRVGPKVVPMYQALPNMLLHYIVHQKHRYTKCRNFVAMVAKTPRKSAFSLPSLHKMAEICTDGKCQRGPAMQEGDICAKSTQNQQT